MPRPEKVQAVADIKERIETARAVFVAEYAGLSVKEQQELRRGLRASESEFKVVKMTLARRAVEELGYGGLMELLSGPTGLAFADDDAAATAKVLRDFAGDHARLIIKGALFSGEVLPPERVGELADLEPREVLLGRIAGAFQAPMAKLAGLLAAMPRDLASMMQQLIDKMGPVSEAPAEAGADEAPEAPEEPSAEDASAEAGADEAPEGAEEPAADEPAAEEAIAETGDEEPDTDEGSAPEATTDDSAEEAAGDEPAAEAEEED